MSLIYLHSCTASCYQTVPTSVPTEKNNFKAQQTLFSPKSPLTSKVPSSGNVAFGRKSSTEFYDCQYELLDILTKIILKY